MKGIYWIWISILSVCLFCISIQAYADERQGFVTEEMSIDERERVLTNINLSLSNVEFSKKAIVCFDVNEQGLVAIGTEEGEHKTVCIYSDTGNFQYGYRFETSGSFGVELNDEVLNIYFVRGDIIVSIDSRGEIQNVSRICDTSENNTYWNKFVRATHRDIGNYQYVLKNDVGILGIFASSYSQLYRIDENGNQLLIYDANTIQFFNMLISFWGILLFISIVVVAIIKELKKLQKENANNFKY